MLRFKNTAYFYEGQTKHEKVVNLTTDDQQSSWKERFYRVRHGGLLIATFLQIGNTFDEPYRNLFNIAYVFI